MCRGERSSLWAPAKLCERRKRNIPSPGFPLRRMLDAGSFWELRVQLSGSGSRKQPGPRQTCGGAACRWGGLPLYKDWASWDHPAAALSSHLPNTLYRRWSSSSASFKCYMPVGKREEGGGTEGGQRESFTKLAFIQIKMIFLIHKLLIALRLISFNEAYFVKITRFLDSCWLFDICFMCFRAHPVSKWV